MSPVKFKDLPLGAHFTFSAEPAHQTFYKVCKKVTARGYVWADKAMRVEGKGRQARFVGPALATLVKGEVGTLNVAVVPNSRHSPVRTFKRARRMAR